jgi:hypothetical protein
MLDFGRPTGPIFILEFEGFWFQNLLVGPCPVSTHIFLLGPYLELKRGREAAPFWFQIAAPKKDEHGNGPVPREANFGTKDPETLG